MNNVDNKMLAFVLRVSDFGERRREHLDWFGGLINMPARPGSRLFWNENGYIRTTTFCMLLTEYYSKLFRDEGGNGRIYDSKLGRFLSADKVVQDAGSTQNYNSYSYCLNNPLKYADPSGWLVSYTSSNGWDIRMAPMPSFFRPNDGANQEDGGRFIPGTSILFAGGGGFSYNSNSGNFDKAGAPNAEMYSYWKGLGSGVSLNEAALWKKAGIQYSTTYVNNQALALTASIIRYGTALVETGISLQWDMQFKGSNASLHFASDAETGLVSFNTYNLASTLGHIADNSAEGTPPSGLSKSDNEGLTAISGTLMWVGAIPSGAAKPFVSAALKGFAAPVAAANLFGNFSLLQSKSWGDKYHYGLIAATTVLSFTEAGAPISFLYSLGDTYGYFDSEYERANFLQQTGIWMMRDPVTGIPAIPIKIFKP